MNKEIGDVRTDSIRTRRPEVNSTKPTNLPPHFVPHQLSNSNPSGTSSTTITNRRVCKLQSSKRTDNEHSGSIRHPDSYTVPLALSLSLGIGKLPPVIHTERIVMVQ